MGMKGFIFGVLLTSMAFLAWPRAQALFVKKGAVRMNGPVYESVQRWMTESLADKNAEIVEIGEPVLVVDQTWRTVRIRLTSPMGGPMFVDYDGQFEGTSKLLKMMRMDEMLKSEQGAAVIEAQAKYFESQKKAAH